MSSKCQKVSSSVLKRVIRGMLVAAQHNQCAYCGEQMSTIDDAEVPTIEHRLPLSFGGTWDIENLVAIHKRCNQARNTAILKLIENPEVLAPMKVTPIFGNPEAL